VTPCELAKEQTSTRVEKLLDAVTHPTEDCMLKPGDLTMWTDPLNDFLCAYDAWADSPTGPLFDRMLEARRAIDETTREAGLKSETDPQPQWSIVELFGHIRLAGRVSEVERFSIKMLRLDIPNRVGDGWLTTQFIGGAALFRVTPTTEEIARAVAAKSQPEPVHRWELPEPTRCPEGDMPTGYGGTRPPSRDLADPSSEDDLQF
jgi:hypothetical protein